MVHFDDGLCITGKSVIESVCDFGFVSHSMTAAEQHRYEPGHPIARFRGWELMKAHEDYPAHRLLSGAADVSLRTMPQRRNDRGEVKTKEMTNDDAERTGKKWFHSQRRGAICTRWEFGSHCNSASCLALRVLMHLAECLRGIQALGRRGKRPRAVATGQFGGLEGLAACPADQRRHSKRPRRRHAKFKVGGDFKQMTTRDRALFASGRRPQSDQ